MDYETRTEFRFEPSSFWRHDVACVGDVDDLLHSYRVKCKSDFHFARVNATFEFAKATDTAYEVDTFVRTEVFEAENFVEDEVRRDSYVENADWVFVVVSTFFGCE